MMKADATHSDAIKDDPKQGDATKGEHDEAGTR